MTDPGSANLLDEPHIGELAGKYYGKKPVITRLFYLLIFNS